MRQLVFELAPPPAPTFDNFFPGGNQAVVAALQSGPGPMAGPGALFLWGTGASGKTHLLRACVAACSGTSSTELRRTEPRGTELHSTEMRGTEPRSTELRGNAHRGQGRRAVYCPHPFAGLPDVRDCGLLAVDDIERLDLVSQLLLFDLFNLIMAAGGTVIAAASRPPADLKLREDLRTRLASGPVFQLRALADEEKAAALESHARARGMRLSAEMVAYLLSRVARDLGTQIAVLDALDRLSLEQQRPVTMPLLREALRSLEARAVQS